MCVTKKLLFLWAMVQLFILVAMADDDSDPCAAFEKEGYSCDMALSITDPGGYDCVCNKPGTPTVTSTGPPLGYKIPPLPPSKSINVIIYTEFNKKGKHDTITLQGNQCMYVGKEFHDKMHSIESHHQCVQICSLKHCEANSCKHMIPNSRGYSNLERFKMTDKVQSLRNC